MLKQDENEKRRKRHHITQEDFTPECIVSDMLSTLPKDFFKKINTSVLDNSCGTGNILTEILKRKLKNTKNIEEAKEALKSIFGIELMADNVEICRENIYNILIEFYPKIKENITENFKVRQIIKNRIQWGDSLKFDYNNWPSLRGRNPRKKHMKRSFNEKKPAWNNKYPMWVEHKPKPDTQLSLWDF